jgi:DNA polymerase
MTATYEQIMESANIETFLERLSSSNCRRCSLSKHDNRIVIYRGNPEAEIMLVGEAPGLIEDRQGKTFVGPAGVLCDNIFKAVGIDTNINMYLGNICKCRPVAARGSGKQNYTPLAGQRKNCMPYVLREIELINPQIVVVAGLTAARALMGWGSEVRMGDVAGTFFEKERLYYVIYHPAYVIHAQKSGVAAATEARQKMWGHIGLLRDKIDELDIELGGHLEYCCKFCGRTFNSKYPHSHQSGFVCDDCWDERLRATG